MTDRPPGLAPASEQPKEDIPWQCQHGVDTRTCAACAAKDAAALPAYRQWRWWERWTLVVDFPLGPWRVAPRGWFTRGKAEVEAALGEMHSLAYPPMHRGRLSVVRTRDVLKGDASADGSLVGNAKERQS